MTSPNRCLYDFGPFTIDAVKRVLLREGRIVTLPPKAFDTLLALVEHHGQVLEKVKLMEMLWPDSFVEESNLTYNISLLRKALGESPSERRYVLTVPGRGYRFAANVEESDGRGRDVIAERFTKSTVIIQEQEAQSDGANIALPAPRVSSGRHNAILTGLTVFAISGLLASGLWLLLSKKPEGQSTYGPIKSLAVLPFRQLGGDGDEYLGIGIADSLITRLSNLPEIRTRPTSSVLRYGNESKQAAEIGRELGVEAILEGSLRRDGENLRVTVQLVRVKDGSPIWAEKFDERFTDIFKIEDSISGRAAERLALKLTGDQRDILAKHYTDKVEAYQSYLKGRYFTSQRKKESIQKGIVYFKQAIGIDPNYALAYSGLSHAYSILPIASDAPSREVLLMAKEAAMKALEIDDAIAEAHISLATIKLWIEWDWQGAEKECNRAIDLSPNHPGAHLRYAHLLSNVGRHVEAIAEAKLALELDPVSPTINLFLGQFLYQARQYDQAAEQLHDTLEIAPNDWVAHLNLGKVDMQKRNYGEAIAEFQQAREFSGGNTETIAVIGHAFAVSGKRAEAQKVLDELKEMSTQRYVPPYNIAIIYAGLGEKGQTLSWLEKAYSDRDVRLIFLKVEPKWDDLRADPRFTKLLQRVGFLE